jgi:membrane protease YdiL (CAAX protease family)
VPGTEDNFPKIYWLLSMVFYLYRLLNNFRCKINKMDDNLSYNSLYRKAPLYQLFVSLLIVLCAGIFLFIVFLVAGILIFNADSGVLENPSVAVGEKDIAFLRYILISQQISFFIVPAIIILNKLKTGYQTGLMDMKMPRINEVVLVIVLAFCIFPITGFTGELNSTMHLPDWLSGVNQWIIEKEENAARLLDTIMTQDTFWVMILNLLMIAVLPAIGEELIFRGVFQKILSNLFRSGHMAIWVTAFLFSAIHFQFFGFVPRFILGLVFGYLFFWSGTLWLPVISHFVNNAVPVIGAFIYGWDKVMHLRKLLYGSR